MKIIAVSATALLGASLAGGALAEQEHSVAPQQFAQQSQPRQAAPSPSATRITTPEYVQTQARGDLFEIEAGKLAVQKAQSPDLKRFGQMMIDDHTQASQKLEQAIKAGNVSTTPPKTLDTRHQQAVDQLKNMPAGQFDQAYYQSQVQGHREMLALNQAYSQNGDNPALKQFSAQVSPVIQKHLSALQQMASAGGRGGAAGAAGTGSGTATGSSGSQDPGTGASSGAGMGQEQIQRELIGPGGPRQFNQPGRDDGGLRDD
jgi:putative membrane protein